MKPLLEICILAGGQSSRMGRDKSRLRFRGRSLLSWIRSEAAQLPYPVRVIRRDVVPRCGPLGGILTALQTTPGEAVLLLTCDMPLINLGMLERLIRLSRQGIRPVFVQSEKGWGFPALLPRSSLKAAIEQHQAGRHSLQQLAQRLKAHPLRAKASTKWLFNVNTPEDWQRARRLLAARHGRGDGLD